MSGKKVIAVVGATGAQGGGLAQAILADRSGGYSVRAVTRNPDGERAKALAKAGAEVVHGDADDEASMTKAFAGAYGAFCVTAFWEHFSPDRETKQATAMARAAKAAGVSHVVWSTLEDTRRLVPLSDPRMPTIHEKYKVPHFDSKGEADAAFRDLGVPTTYLLTSFYWDNLIHFGMGPKKDADGTYGFALPMADKRLPGIAVGDIGACAYGLFKGGARWIGKTVGIAGEHLTGSDMAAALTKSLGVPVRYQYVPPEVYRTLGFPGAEDLGNMFQFKRDFEREFCGVRDLAIARSLHPGLLTFSRWLEQNRARIPLG